MVMICGEEMFHNRLNIKEANPHEENKNCMYFRTIYGF